MTIGLAPTSTTTQTSPPYDPSLRRSSCAVEQALYVAMFVISASYVSRVLRLVVAYYDRLRYALPWLMSVSSLGRGVYVHFRLLYVCLRILLSCRRCFRSKATHRCREGHDERLSAASRPHRLLVHCIVSSLSSTTRPACDPPPV